jgi:hypothetical protein
VHPDAVERVRWRAACRLVGAIVGSLVEGLVVVVAVPHRERV